MDRLYYLTEEQFTQINRLLPPEKSGRGRPPKIRHRDALEGILHYPAHRHAVARFTHRRTGHWHTIYMRWQRWVERGMWWTILMVLKRLKRIDLQHCLSRFHGGAGPPACRRRPQKKGDQALGRSRGGLSTKMHALCGSESDAIDLRITAGPSRRCAGGGRADRRPRYAVRSIRQAAMDKAYDSNAIRAKLAAQGHRAPVIPPQSQPSGEYGV